MTIKDKLLSGGYTPAETFVCQEGHRFLESVYNAINNTQLRAYEVLYDYFLPREKDSVTRLMKFEKIWANKITHPILVPKTYFTKLRRERCEVFSLAYESPCIILDFLYNV